MGRHRRVVSIFLVMIFAVFSMGQLNPEEEFELILFWEKPDPYPPVWLDGMDKDTLSKLLDAGNLQWYEPRPDKDKWEAVVGMKVHAPHNKVWEVITDYPALCKILPLTYLACETEYRKGNEVKNNQKGQTTVLKFAYKYDIIDIVTEDPPFHHHVDTIEGLEKRQLDIILIPVDGGKNTMMFMRYYLNMAALGISMQAVMAVLPMTEPPTAVGAANYHSRAYKNEAEKRVGYKALAKPLPLDMTDLDLKTLKMIDERGGGIIRETLDGKTIDALSYKVINAKPETVWDVITDFDNYENIFTGSSCKVESKNGNEVILTQETSKFSVLIFSFGYELHAKYTLDPPYHLSYKAIDGIYEGSHGEFNIVPIENGQKTLLFHSVGLNLEKDNGLTARIAKSGAFPLENMLNAMGAQSSLARIRMAAENK
jgi:carbon monoxide dehydrogenase subunit G